MPLFSIMKIDNCRFCHSMLPPPKTLEISKEIITLYTCSNCGLIQSPEIKKDYSSGDLISYYNERKEWISLRHKYIFDTVENLVNKNGPIKFLDIGCGIGFSLLEAKSRGWSALGIEPNKDLAFYANNHLKVSVTNSYFSSATALNEKFDFILIDNVIEHLNSPYSMVSEASSLISEDGLMLIAVPPVDFFRRALSKSRYIREKIGSATINMFNDTYEHINFVPRSAMENLVSKMNLKMVDVNFHHHKKFELIQKFFYLESGYFFIKRS